MRTTSPRTPHTPRPRATRPLPTTIWLPAPDQPHAAPTPGTVLPDWAIERARTVFTTRADQRPAPLLKISVRDTEPGMDTRTPVLTYTDGAPSRLSLLLAELHPDALPTPTNAPTCGGASEMPGAMEDGWPGFFYRAHRLLPADGLLLLATRQRRDEGILTDPLGSLIACARTAGFRYLQHVIVAHAHPADDRLIPTPPTDASPGVAHSDLIALSAIHHTGAEGARS
ncbi:hypothetical protein K2224_37365 (plasmid) [Streptomyces sp. BHT-5-2]|uniref:hypothetical protein n=1 Tax=Streptomyces sp. BHT-5-2 TaxID=2866715 RepID=UPI001C8EF687|nr:hypothetical protein [Streptomyces sp. BHT-5-2]QZL08721.1 hypothetical protein K2224_37365 [Streptomyces sp. BHT-5-2]